MPAAAVKSLAKKAGISAAKAEDRWEKAKSLADNAGRKDDFKYVMGIFKKSLGMKEAADIIDNVVAGFDTKRLVESLSNPEHVCTFFDESGELAFSTLDGVRIWELDSAKHLLVQIAQSLPADSDLHEVLDNFEGTADALLDKVLDQYVVDVDS